MSDITIYHNSRPLRGEITVPGDKSISHRAVILGSIAEGISVVAGLLESGDILSTVDAFRLMGITIDKTGSKYRIEGKGMHGLTAPVSEIDAGNSGTTARLLTGLLSGQDFNSVITGDKYLRKRPMKRVTEPLRLMGADITGEADGENLPLRINGRKLSGIEYTTPVASAQIKSALILAGMYADGKTKITEPQKTRDHTERMLSHFGVKIRVSGNSLEVERPEKLKSAELEIPSDISSAAFFIVAALITRGSELMIRNVGLNPQRTGIIEILRTMNADIKILNMREQCGEPVGDILAVHSRLKGTHIGGSLIPGAIDELPVIAVAACFAEGQTVISDAQELRVKETDRISAMTTELSGMGADIQELRDGMLIRGSETLSGARCRSWGDHRIAMSLAIAAGRAGGETVIEGAECVSISFPGFFTILDRLRS